MVNGGGAWCSEVKQPAPVAVDWWCDGEGCHPHESDPFAVGCGFIHIGNLCQRLACVVQIVRGGRGAWGVERGGEGVGGGEERAGMCKRRKCTS